ncbi:tetratricopeptide repeat protein [Caulifigura coniformis]|uniref:tetratricopeptide repeat protein n=1 Tax=Caulifigura coniformis TaxID=2527983 RepID=UPI0018D25D3D|nr:tetratricopeptide repeat protein [Caulifigura coniformis]
MTPKSYETVAADPHRDTEAAIAKNEKALKHIHAAHWDHAEKALQDALVADVRYGPAHNNLGWVYYKQGRYYLAAWEFEYAQKLMTGIPEPVNNLGLVYEEVGRLAEAQACFDQAAGADPGNPQFLANLARVRLKQGERSTDTAHLLREVAFRDERPEWREWALEHLSSDHRDLVLVGNEVCEPVPGHSSSWGPVPLPNVEIPGELLEVPSLPAPPSPGEKSK